MYLRVRDSESTSTGNIKSVKKTRDEKDDKSENLYHWCEHDEGHAFDGAEKLELYRKYKKNCQMICILYHR